MNELFLFSLLTLASLNAFSAPNQLKSEKQLKSCISSVYLNASNSSSVSKDVIKEVSFGVKECRKQISDLKKSEAKAKKLANNAKRIEKLKEQLAKLTSK